MINKQLESPLPSHVIFCLTRGYSNWQKFRYFKLVLRNLLIRKAAKKDIRSFDLLIFHEGNIKKLDIFFIKLFSLNLKIKFKTVEDYFEMYKSHEKILKNDKHLGYTMMCRFHYGKVWQYLINYSHLIRIDDDCFISKIPTLGENEIFLCSGISNETHKETNESLPRYLQQKNLELYYDHKFPYTNLYITQSSFWRNKQVDNFLLEILNDSQSTPHRWGDMPIIGVALKAFGGWDYKTGIIANYQYEHFSHRSIVSNGDIVFKNDNAFKILIIGILKLF
jgi:hypothetical protein